MRRKHVCPKCGHNEILYVPQIADRDDRDIVRPIVFHVVHYDWRDDMELGKISAYACRSCGYTELYTKDIDKLPVDKIPGAKILKGQ
jgi:predicted nucleic-acid-binding Zn-ribbon protein